MQRGNKIMKEKEQYNKNNINNKKRKRKNN